MFKAALSFISPYIDYLKIGAWFAAALLIGWLYIQKGYFQGEYLTAKGKLNAQDAQMQAWEQSHNRMIKYMQTQNKAIEELKIAKNEAENKRIEAIKKAQIRVQARQAIINKPPLPENGSISCDDAVAKAISDLDGSEL